MMELGGVISEFPPDMPPLKFHFPKRNRIIAGISSCTLLIESKTKGGGIITAKLASSYNRDVFAVPGNINNPSSKGSTVSPLIVILSPIFKFKSKLNSLPIDIPLLDKFLLP